MKFIRNIILLTGLLIPFHNSLCQVKVEPGLYKVMLNIQGTGYCYIKPDSDFVFCGSNIAVLKNTYPNSWKVFDDSISSAGTGRWYVEDSLLILSFNTMGEGILRNTELKYSAKTVQPYDSLFLSLDVNMEGKNKLFSYLISFPGYLTPVQGSRAKIVIPYKAADSVLMIHLTDKYKYAVRLSGENNFHDIQINFPKQDTRFEMIENTSSSFRCSECGSIFKNNFFQREGEGAEKLKNILQQNINWFPERKNLYNFLLKKIEE